MNNEKQEIRARFDIICDELAGKGEAGKGKLLCYNHNRNLIWYIKHLPQALDIIVQSGSPCGIGKTLNTQFIVLRENVSQDKKNYWLHITLTNLEDINTFGELIMDLIDYSNDATSDADGVGLIVERFSMWKNMLKHKGEEREVVKGIIGELLTIKHLLVLGNDGDIVINGWGGPKKTQQDFILDRFWIETKTVGEDPSVVTINNIGQLDNKNTDGYLYVIKTKISDGDDGVWVGSLYDEICQILQKQGKNDALLTFKNKMSEFEYNRFCLPNTAYKYDIVNEDVYKVEEDFPRLLNEYQKPGIKSVHYDLVLSALGKWFDEKGVEAWK